MAGYFEELNKEFTHLGDPTDAAQMKAYMKDRSDFQDIRSPQRKDVFKGTSKELLDEERRAIKTGHGARNLGCVGDEAT